MPVGPSSDLAVHRLVDGARLDIPTAQSLGGSGAVRPLASGQASATVAVSVSGPGSGQLVAQAGGYLLQLTGTSTATSVAVVVSDGSRLALPGFSAGSAVGALDLANADLDGTATFAAALQMFHRPARPQGWPSARRNRHLVGDN